MEKMRYKKIRVIITAFILFILGNSHLFAQSFGDLWSQNGGTVLEPEKSQPASKTPSISKVKKDEISNFRFQNIEVQENGPSALISGNIQQPENVRSLVADNEEVLFTKDGDFSVKVYVPIDGHEISLKINGKNGKNLSKTIQIARIEKDSSSLKFAALNPLKRRVGLNANASALIIGISEYKETNAGAIYADIDAKIFKDYATEKLGIPNNRIKILINDGAELTDMLLSAKNWLSRSVKQGKTDVYVFFAGHGLASDNGEKMYLLPYDGSPQFLDRTAILRDELFSDIASANPRSVTVFLDTCYSGTTRGTDMLIAARPIAIRAKQQNIPDGFTVFTAAGGDQTAKPLEEAKHGMFSYFLMKGMEGDADSNNDNQITAAELHEYVEQNVVQQSGGSQVPELQGDANRVLVRFQ